jgi:hypothetical protein
MTIEPMNLDHNSKQNDILESTLPSQKIILIDDDSLVHLMWKMVATKKNLNLVALSDENEFNALAPEFPVDAKVYIDKNLSGGINGIEVAKRIFDKGFKNIYLATGEDHILNGIQKVYPFFKGVIGKEPPF